MSEIKSPNEYTRGKNPNSRNGFKKGHKGYKASLGKKCSVKTKKKMGLAKLGKIGNNKGKHWKIKQEKLKNMSRGKMENHPNWQGGKSFELYGFEWTDLLKHSIRTRDLFICKICKKNGWVIHHIDYDKQNCNPDNLITLCNSCHVKTNFNRKYWINYFKIKI